MPPIRVPFFMKEVPPPPDQVPLEIVPGSFSFDYYGGILLIFPFPSRPFFSSPFFPPFVLSLQASLHTFVRAACNLTRTEAPPGTRRSLLSMLRFRCHFFNLQREIVQDPPTPPPTSP